MSTVETEPIPERDDITKAKRLVFLRHLAHEGIMIDRVNRNLHAAERLQTFAATADVNDLNAPAGDEDEMGVNIGNEYHEHHVHNYPAPPVAIAPPATTEPTNATTPAEPAPATDSGTTQKKSKWWPLLIGGVLLGTAAGAGGGYIIHDWLKPPAQSAGVDTDTITELDFPS